MGQHIPAEGVQVCCRPSVGLLVLIFLFMEQKVLFALEFHVRPLEMSTPKYLALETTFRRCPCWMFEVLEAFLEVSTIPPGT